METMVEALAQARGEQYNKLALRYLDTLSAMAARMGDYAAAYRYLHEHRQLRDSLDRASQAGRVARYETELKEREIDRLNHDRQLKEAEIERQWLIRRIFGGAFLVAMVFAFIFLRQRNRIGRERKRSDELLRNILPDSVAAELKYNGKAEAKHFDEVTVLFTDFKDFTTIAEGMPPSELVAELDTCFSAFDEITARHGLEKIKTIGDSYMCAAGLPVPAEGHAVKAVAAALEMQRFMEVRAGHAKPTATGGTIPAPRFSLRIGIHSGPVVAGIVGTRKFAYDIWGDTVNTASRMESAGEAGKINISGATRELVKNHYPTTLRGQLKVKNKGEVEMWWVENGTGP
jgi:class 3 adenylate cyclase